MNREHIDQLITETNKHYPGPSQVFENFRAAFIRDTIIDESKKIWTTQSEK